MRDTAFSLGGLVNEKERGRQQDDYNLAVACATAFCDRVCLFSLLSAKESISYAREEKREEMELYSEMSRVARALRIRFSKSQGADSSSTRLDSNKRRVAALEKNSFRKHATLATKGKGTIALQALYKRTEYGARI